MGLGSQFSETFFLETSLQIIPGKLQSESANKEGISTKQCNPGLLIEAGGHVEPSLQLFLT